MQIKNPLKGSIIFGRKKKKNSSLRKTAGNRKLFCFHPACFDSTASPYHEKAKRLISMVPSFNRRGFRLCGLSYPILKAPPHPNHTHSNNEVEKEVWQSRSSNSKIVWYRVEPGRESICYDLIVPQSNSPMNLHSPQNKSDTCTNYDRFSPLYTCPPLFFFHY